MIRVEYYWETIEVKAEPEEIPDTEHELVLERVCAVDVAKDSGKVCVRVSSRAGRRVSKVWDVAARSGAVAELAERLVDEGIEKVTVESTSDYWRIWFYVLEAAGLSVQLVNARDVKNVPGRPKTDKLDAVWLAKLTEKGLLRPSFVPPAPVRELRDYTRLRIDLTRERSRYWQRLEKLLEDALIKVSAVASTLDTLSVRDMLEALIAGERDPRRLAGLARGRMRVKHGALVEALTGRFDDHHAGYPDAARPDRRVEHPDRHPDHPHRRAAHRDANPKPAPTSRTRLAALAPSPAAPARRPPSSGSMRFPASARDSRRSFSPRSGST